MKSSISSPGGVTTTATILAGAAAPGLGQYGDGADGALTLVANTEIADGPPICRRYSTGDLAGYYLSGRSQAYGYLALFFSGQLNLNGGAIYAPGDGSAAAAGGASAAPTKSGNGGAAGGVGSGPHEDHGREALYVYAKSIIGTGTISSKGGSGVAGSTPTVTPDTNVNGNPGSNGTQTTACKGTAYAGVGGGTSRGEGGIADSAVGAVVPGGTPNNANNTVAFTNDIRDIVGLIYPFNTPYATTGPRRTSVSPDGGGGGAGGCCNGWPPGNVARAGGGGAGGSFRQRPGGGAGGQGSYGTQCTGPAPDSGSGGAGGGGLPGGVVVVVTESAPSTLTVTANGGDGGNGGDSNGAGSTQGGGGGGGGGGEGGVSILVSQSTGAPTATAAGGAAGARGTGGTTGTAAVAGQAGWPMNLRKDT